MTSEPEDAGTEAERVPGNDIQVVARAAELLRLLVVADAIDVVTAAEALGIGRSSAHRYLASMERHGFLARRDRNSYEIGTLMTQLGAAALARSGVIRTARPVLEALRDEIRQTITLSLWNGDVAVVSLAVEANSQMAHVSVPVGRALSKDAAQTAIFRAFVDRTPFRRSPSVQPPVSEQHQEIRRAGIAIREHDGIRAVAAPILDSSGVVVATIAAVGIAQLMPEGVDSPVAVSLVRAATHITQELERAEGPALSRITQRGA